MMSDDRCQSEEESHPHAKRDDPIVSACRDSADEKTYLEPILREFTENIRAVIGKIHQHQEAREIPFFAAPGRTFSMRERKENLSALPDLTEGDTLSLDIFDTCLIRLLETPEKMAQLLGYHVERLTGLERARFASLRRTTEVRLRKQGLADGTGEDTSINAIYDDLQASLKWESGIRHLIQEKEIFLERRFLRAVQPILEYFKKARASGIPVVFTSEMYFPGSVLRDLLVHAGFPAEEILVYSSGEYALSKGTGNLYRRVLQEINGKQLIHVGDNPVSDGEVPAASGITTCIIQTQKSVYPDIFSNVLAAVSTHPSRAGHSGYWESFGYRVAGPVHFAFATHLYRKSRDRDLRRLFFLSRDGWFPVKVFKKLQESWGSIVEDNYLYASREFLTIGSMEDIGKPEWDFILKPSPLLKTRDVFERLGIPVDMYADLIQKLGLPPADHLLCHHWGYRDPEMPDRLYAAICECLPAFIKYRGDIAANLRDYLEHVRLFESGTAIVDLGWGGSSTHALNKLAPEPGLNPYAFYFALLHPLVGKAEGYFTEGGERMNLLKGSIALLEFLFGSPEATVRNVTMESGEAKPVFRKAWRKTEQDAWTKMEKGILDFTGDCLDVLSMSPEGDGSCFIEDILRDWLYHPSEEDLSSFAAISHSEGWGTDNRMRILPKQNLPDDADLYREALSYCPWKPGLQAQLHVANSSAHR